MPAQINGTMAANIPIHNASDQSANCRKQHKHQRSSYSDASPLANSRNNSFTFRPPKRVMTNTDKTNPDMANLDVADSPKMTPKRANTNKTIAVINASGRQASSLIRYATAVGYKVRAQMRNTEGIMAAEVAENENVTVLVGELYTMDDPTEENEDVTQNGDLDGVGVNKELISELFRGAQLAFINTTFYGNEVKIGRALARAAQKAGIEHYVYSSMPDHAHYNAKWPSLPLWAAKHQVEDYVRQLGLPATIVYTGIYNNNFTSLKYPLFCTDLQEDGSFIWKAPFHENAKLPWLDAEHDVGPAILQIFMDPKEWLHKRIALAFEYLTPIEVCEQFSLGVGRPVKYVRGEIEIEKDVPIPKGYKKQLEALEELFSPDIKEAADQPPYFGDPDLEASCPGVASRLWLAPRGMKEYAADVFPLEEEANQLDWMHDDYPPIEGDEKIQSAAVAVEQMRIEDESDDDDDGLVMSGPKRSQQQWLA